MSMSAGLIFRKSTPELTQALQRVSEPFDVSLDFGTDALESDVSAGVLALTHTQKLSTIVAFRSPVSLPALLAPQLDSGLTEFETKGGGT